ncbi:MULTISPECIES: ABC transporter permease [Rhizobium]|uniref:ABC transporter permease subunit n=2 Tax=Rhizobium TaxID=379 RepID=A0AAF1K1Z6_9HYPH|nr:MULTISPECIES: ABC transporter permease subunit [Rhizobium]MBZ5758565.1 ABC transporter permease subunit [Rhizobium sp. VS19-DR96]MBZ5764605.1 ABC transporter permease subunit [Rhizobium sp. VS19-DR129.2]MBZ5772148.1 ABC transporter permease subunit [Rhizobium sp. VS19-DRK62.2]MBZ5783165.1 ABC transporter permease subunit [Rhizobium sp. VS19-DR121]MBZ5800613.1 ABC transporter permease subunit [Rhizobium sp. VS19-DR181]
MTKRFPIVSTFIVIVAASYFLIPLYATFQFSLQMLRGQWSFAAYRSVFSSEKFLATLGFSATASLLAIIAGALIVVPTAYWVRLKLPKIRPMIEFISLMPLIIPPVVLVFGYIRLFGSNSFLPLTMSETGTNVLLVIGYVVLSLPYMFRAVDNGMAAIDIKTLTEAAESLGASRLRTVAQVIFPNIRSAILSGAFLTFSISLGEFVLASLLNRPAFGPYLVQTGQDRAYEPAALAIMSFGIIWFCMVLMQLFATKRPGQRWLPRLSQKTARSVEP